MSRQWNTAALSLLTVLAALGPQPARLSAQDGSYRVTMAGRPRIGVMVDATADSAKDKIGARIREVTPQGPADRAGLKSGDIITKFNGTSLGGIPADDKDESGPGQKLIELARKLDVGDTVVVAYRRGSETRTARIIAEDVHMSGMMKMPGGMYSMPDLPRMRGFGSPDGDFGMFMHDGIPDLDLVDLNPDLGDYFGTRTGVLVVSAPSDSTIPLKAGDVILKIDGREPKDVSQASRILRSYDAGETAKLDVMRKQKRLILNWTVTESRDHEWHWKMPDDGTPRVHIERS